MSLEDMIAKKAKEALEAKFGVDPDEYLGKVGMSTDSVIEKAGGMLGLGGMLGEHTPSAEHGAEHHAEHPTENNEDNEDREASTDDNDDNREQEDDSRDSRDEDDNQNDDQEETRPEGEEEETDDSER